MLTTTILGLSAVLLAYLGRYRNTRWGLKASFGLIFLFLALRYDFGNDYGVYLQTFRDIRASARLEDFSNPIKLEIGWLYLNWLFRPVGFFAMVAVLALLNCVVYYRFLSTYLPPRLYWLAVFLYVFTPQFMLIQASAMRQTIAIVVFVYSIDYIVQRKPVHFTLCVALASFFHITAFVLWPAYLLGSRKWTPGVAMRAVSIGGFVALFLFGQMFSPYVKQLVSTYFPKYVVYQSAGNTSTGLGFIYVFAMLGLFLYFEPFQDRSRRLMLRLGAAWCMLAPITFILSLLARFGMYLAPATLVAYPLVFVNLRRPNNRIAFLAVVCVFTLYSYVRFFASEMGTVGYVTYKTIFSGSGGW